MKRWTIRITVLLLLGAIVNIAVTWGLACWAPTFNPSAVLRSDSLAWPIEPPEGWKQSPNMIGRGTTFGNTHELWVSSQGDAPYATMGVTESGWPCRVIRGHHWALSSSPAHVIGLPTRVIWPGFAINTAFYAAVLAAGWMLFAAPFALRRRVRIKRGLCAKCGYDLRGNAAPSAKCPECGAAVDHSASRLTPHA